MTSDLLPHDIVVLERGWLSSNNVLLLGENGAALVDSGYGAHAAQTVDLIGSALRGRSLDLLVNTHLHSDHCGGNAALQVAYTGLTTLIPPGLSSAVHSWNEGELSYARTGQCCPRFSFTGLLRPGDTLLLGSRDWEVHAAPGHDPDAIILFQPGLRALISADALWANGFGVVFPEIEGERAFDAVGQTLDLIESLRPRVVIPGHGSVFSDVEDALGRARERLAKFTDDPLRHARYAAKVLIKFKLLEMRVLSRERLNTWIADTPYFAQLHEGYFRSISFSAWIAEIVQDLIRSEAAEAGIMDGRPAVFNRP